MNSYIGIVEVDGAIVNFNNAVVNFDGGIVGLILPRRWGCPRTSIVGFTIWGHQKGSKQYLCGHQIAIYGIIIATALPIVFGIIGRGFVHGNVGRGH